LFDTASESLAANSLGKVTNYALKARSIALLEC
jgi:hypothetical protein